MKVVLKGLVLSFVPALVSVAVAQQFEVGRVDAGKGAPNTQTLYLQSPQPLSTVRIEALNEKGRTGQTQAIAIDQAQVIFEIPGRTDGVENLDGLRGGWNESETSRTVSLQNQRYRVKAIVIGVRRLKDKNPAGAIVQASASQQQWHPEPQPPVYYPPQPPVYYPPQPPPPPVYPQPYYPVRNLMCDSSNSQLIDLGSSVVHDFYYQSDCEKAKVQVQNNEPFCDSSNSVLYDSYGRQIHDFYYQSDCEKARTRVNSGLMFCDSSNSTLRRPDGSLIHDFYYQSDCEKALSQY